MPKLSPAPTYEIVVNDAREYAIWPSQRPLPEGWRHSGKAGPRDELTSYLRSVFAPVVPLDPPVRK